MIIQKNPVTKNSVASCKERTNTSAHLASVAKNGTLFAFQNIGLLFIKKSNHFKSKHFSKYLSLDLLISLDGKQQKLQKDKKCETQRQSRSLNAFRYKASAPSKLAKKNETEITTLAKNYIIKTVKKHIKQCFNFY